MPVPRGWELRLRDLCEERPGLPRGGHGRFWPVPAAPRPVTAEPLSPAGGASGETNSRKGKTLERRGMRTKSVRNGSVSTEAEGGGGALGAQAETPLRPVGRPQWGRGKVWGGKSGRAGLLWTDRNLYSPSPVPPG